MRASGQGAASSEKGWPICEWLSYRCAGLAVYREFGPPPILLQGSAGFDEVVWWDMRLAGYGPLLFQPPSRSEHCVGNLSPESARAGVIVLETDRPGAFVPGKHADSQPTTDPLTAHRGGNPESCYRPPVAGKPFDHREPDRRVLASIGMSPPGQVPRPVRRGESLQLSCLVPAVGVREPVDDGGQVMPEHLPQPGHDRPFIIRHRTDAK